MSLSQLKSTPVPDAKKGPLKENLSALRQALAAAMKDAPPTPKPASPIVAPAIPAVSTAPAAQSHSSHIPHAAKPAAENEVKKEEPKAQVHQPQPQHTHPKEVPEHVLKGVLEVK